MLSVCEGVDVDEMSIDIVVCVGVDVDVDECGHCGVSGS